MHLKMLSAKWRSSCLRLNMSNRTTVAQIHIVNPNSTVLGAFIVPEPKLFMTACDRLHQEQMIAKAPRKYAVQTLSLT